MFDPNDNNSQGATSFQTLAQNWSVKKHSIILWYIHGNPSFISVNYSLMKRKQLSCYFHALYYDHIPHTYNIKYYDAAIKYFCHLHLQALLYLFSGRKISYSLTKARAWTSTINPEIHHVTDPTAFIRSVKQNRSSNTRVWISVVAENGLLTCNVSFITLCTY